MRVTEFPWRPRRSGHPRRLTCLEREGLFQFLDSLPDRLSFFLLVGHFEFLELSLQKVDGCSDIVGALATAAFLLGEFPSPGFELFGLPGKILGFFELLGSFEI